jgi:DNA sulfur modification protein DndE
VPDLTLKRVPFSQEADSILRMMKARTGITPNVLCRLGLCLSLDEPGRPRPVDRKLPTVREINRYTLLGEYDFVLVALLRARVQESGIKMLSLDDDFLAHIQRGIELLAGRVKSLQDFAGILSS